MADASLDQTNPNRRLWHDLRLLRMFGTLLIAVLPLVAASTLMSVIAGTDVSDGEEQSGLILAYPFILVWLGICAGVHLGLIRILGYATRRQCLIWGLLASLVPGAAFIDTSYFSSLESDQAGSWVDTFRVIGVLGALFLPTGLLSGWIYWRIGIRPRPRVPDNISRDKDQAGDRFLTPRHRRWRDLHAGRLSLALCLGPIAITLLLALIWIVDGSMTTGEMIRAAIATLIFVLAWCLINGWIYLLLVVRRRRRIGRFECLLLGLIIADLFPLALAALMFGIEGWEGVASLVDNPGADPSYAVIILVAIEVLFAAMGLLSGWLFWRFGVRPAPPPHPDVSAVFD